MLILIAGCGLFYLSKGLKEGKNIKIETVNPNALGDGIYSGKYESGRWSNEVNIIIKDHKITKINVIKDVTFSKTKVRDELINNVIQKQCTNIDVISGATVTSKAYLKSIENALKRWN